MKMRNTLLYLIGTILSLLAISNTMDAQQNFQLNIQKVYTPQEVVQVQFYQYYNRRRGSAGKLDKVKLALYQVEDYQSFLKALGKNPHQTTVTDEILKDLPAIRCWEEPLSYNKNNYYRRQHLELGKLSEGVYVLEAIGNGQSANVPVFVSKYGIFTRSLGEDLVAYTHELQTGKAKDGFKYQAFSGDQTIEPVNVKDNLATFDFSKLEGNNHNQFPILAFKGKSFAISQSYVNRYYADQNNGIKSYTFTDRPAYRPEQTVQFKGIIRQKNGFDYDVVDKSVICLITDAQRNEVLKKEYTLDAEGTFSGELALDANASLGEYRIITYFKEEGNNPNNRYWQYYREATTFKVEEYKKPEYEVLVNLDKPQYTSGETITANIAAKYFFGSPVTNAKVQYKVVRELFYVPWYYYMRCGWWYEHYYRPSHHQEVVDNGTAQIGEDGTLTIHYNTNNESKQAKLHRQNNYRQSNYRYTIIAEVQDASRRTITGSSSVIVAHTSFTLTAHSEKYYYFQDESIKVKVAAYDYSKNPVSTKIKATLKARKSYLFDSEKELDHTTVQTDPKTGEAYVEFDSPGVGYYEVLLESTDDNGKTTEARVYTHVLKENEYRYRWWQNAGQIEILTDKKVYNSGEEVKAMVYVPKQTDALFTLNSNAFAHAQLYDFDGKGNDEEEGAFKEIVVKIPQSAYGQLQLFTSYIYKNQLYQYTQNITVIPQQKYLDVSLTFDESEYKPRTIAEATVKVTDVDGNPVPNANVTLGTADESIYFLYPDKTKDIRKSFYDNQSYHAANYHNQFNAYNQSQAIQPKALLWKLEKLDFAFDRRAYLDDGEWMRFNYTIKDKEAATEKKIEVQGFVVDYETGQPLSNATIKVGGKSYQTNKFGYYNLSAPQEGIIEKMTFEKDGKITTVTNVVCHTDTNILLNIAIKDKNKTIEFSRLVAEIPAEYEALDEEMSMDMMTREVAGAVGAPGPQGASGPQGNPLRMTMGKSAVAGRLESKDKESGGGGALVEATVRSDFQDAIYWNPNITTDANGEATVKIQLPDNLTTWRTNAKVATRSSEIGQTNAKIIVRKNLLVRMETPRFMNVGDDLVIATNIHNYLDSKKKVKVQLFADGLKVEGSEKDISIPANGEERIDWKVESKWINNASLTVKALTNEESDAMVLEIPVNPYGLEIISAESTVLRDKDQQSIEIEIPKDIDLNTAQLEVSAAPSVTSALLASMDQLIGYPYGCVEQTMSRFLPTVVVANTLQELGESYESTISRNELQKMVAQGFKRLGELQQQDGGWGWWRNDGSHPFMTAYVVNGMFLATQADFVIDQAVYNKAINAFKSQLQNKGTDATTLAYQMMVAMNLGLTEFWDDELLPKGNENAYEQALWLQAAVLAKDNKAAQMMLARLEDNATVEGTQTYWGGKKFYYRWQDDRVETTANAIKAISMIEPDNDYLPNAIQWILRQRKGHAWHNTRQTAMTIYGLIEVIKNEVNPDLELEIYANGALVGSKKVGKDDVFSKAFTLDLVGVDYYANTSNNINLDVNNTKVLKSGKNTIEVKQKGNGTHYINTRLTYFAAGEQLEKYQKVQPIFEVEREYYKLMEEKDNKGNLIYDKQKIKLKNIASGDNILVKTKVTTVNEQEYVLIEDPIPAGCEFVQDTKGYNIKGETGYDRHNGNQRRYGYGYWSHWYTHKEYRDEHLALTITKLPTGTFEYTYLMKAQIPGNYQIKPVVAQLMYYPENRGYSEFDKVVITD